MADQSPGKISVLIADDEQADRDLLKWAVSNHAPHFDLVGEVVDGGQLIEYLSGKGQYADRDKHPLPDLLFLDLRMPGRDGFAVLEWLQEHHFPHLKIAVLADSSGIAYRSEALVLGANYFFGKCSKMDELADMVRWLQHDMLGHS
jgi:DNA-binding NarL/FixJ family response regulator